MFQGSVGVFLDGNLNHSYQWGSLTGDWFAVLGFQSPPGILQFEVRGYQTKPSFATIAFWEGEDPKIFTPPLKTDVTLENHHFQIFNRKYIFRCWIFHCHVSFLGGYIQIYGRY